MSSGHRAPDDEAADAMLRAALRHAPDREAAPPPAVSRAILAAARRAAAPRRRPGLLPALGAGWTSLWRQPAAGAAFASLMLGTLIVLMWRDGAPPEAGSHIAETAARPQSASATPAASTIGPAAAAPTEARTDASAGPAPAKPARTQAADAAAPVAPGAPGARSDRMAKAEDTRHRASTVAGRPSAPAPAPNITAAPASPATPEPASPAPAVPAARAEAAVASSPRQAALADARAGAAAQAGTAAAVAAASQDVARPTERVSADPLAPVLAALRTPPGAADTFERQAALAARNAADKAAAETAEARPAAAASHAEDRPLPRALRDARAAARGRWQLVDATGLAAGTELRSPAGAALGRIAVEADALLWQPVGLQGRLWRAALPPEVLARLRSALPAEPAPDAPSGSPAPP